MSHPAERARSLAPLRALARAYMREASAMSFGDLRARQDAPWASVAFGAGGVAYALWHGASGAQRRVSLIRADRWLRSASAARRGAFTAPGATGIDLGTSVFYGRDGLRFIALLVSHSGGDRAHFDAGVRAFAARCRATRGGDAELMMGVAGYLTALLILHRHTGTPRALATGDLLAADLLRARWTRDGTLGFAHGRAGIFHALLGWSLASDRDLPAWFFRALARFAGDAETARLTPRPEYPERVVRREQQSWCGGATGHALLWARAFERTGDATYLRLARRAARLIQPHADSPADLCCGLVGQSYALLAMERVEPGREWYDGALALAVRAGERMQTERKLWPNGLFKGYPGLVCLVRDLQREPAERIGFPLVEG